MVFISTIQSIALLWINHLKGTEERGRGSSHRHWLNYWGMAWEHWCSHGGGNLKESGGVVVFGSALRSDFAYWVASSGPLWSPGGFCAPLAALRWKYANDRATFITVQLVRVRQSRKQKAAETTEGRRGSARTDRKMGLTSLTVCVCVCARPRLHKWYFYLSGTIKPPNGLLRCKTRTRTVLPICLGVLNFFVLRTMTKYDNLMYHDITFQF